MLTKFWFVRTPNDRFGIHHFGVTASTKQEASDILSDYLGRLDPEDALHIHSGTEVIENIDIRLLDQNHIIPNMGFVTFKGIWWPRLNL